ncbi:alpha/beta hydrolase [Salinadaptatus halalkaliphilus]|uniref:Alpha/beta hydrolase n=1 Tax=Salinadaptatus halalkaliphilus TaxID=2419781 RepID=A0A4S3TLE3_9EURY|nr:alpha/beta hydrolase [Salinadaptatus halalkaliphilus]THE64981.1 alpha/beta hydrolase [Salinadaptatus halalkaliphilus]
MEPTTATSDALPTDVGSRTDREGHGVDLHAVVAGEETDPLVVFLHGFPEWWYTWRDQLEPFVDAGYRVLVPDQRGYNLSDKPQSVRAYRQSELARDIISLIRSEGRESAHVVGHDWGGMIGWYLALEYPAVVDRLAVVNAPHPTAFRRQLLSNPEQIRRSWYAYVFQLPWLPERVCRHDDYRVLERTLRSTSAPGTYTDTAVAHYRRTWSQDGALTGMCNWYRASARYPPDLSRDRVAPPTLVIWGEDDSALVPALAVDSYDFCADARLELLPETSHWVPRERPARTTSLLLEHLHK